MPKTRASSAYEAAYQAVQTRRQVSRLSESECVDLGVRTALEWGQRVGLYPEVAHVSGYQGALNAIDDQDGKERRTEQ